MTDPALLARLRKKVDELAAKRKSATSIPPSAPHEVDLAAIRQYTQEVVADHAKFSERLELTQKLAKYHIPDTATLSELDQMDKEDREVGSSQITLGDIIRINNYMSALKSADSVASLDQNFKDLKIDFGSQNTPDHIQEEFDQERDESTFISFLGTSKGTVANVQPIDEDEKQAKNTGVGDGSDVRKALDRHNRDSKKLHESASSSNFASFDVESNQGPVERIEVESSDGTEGDQVSLEEEDDAESRLCKDVRAYFNMASDAVVSQDDKTRYVVALLRSG